MDGNYSHTWELFSSVLVDSHANFGKWSLICELPTHIGHKTVFGNQCSLSFPFVNTKPMWWKHRPYMKEQTDAQRKTGNRGRRRNDIKKLNIFMNLCQNEKNSAVDRENPRHNLIFTLNSNAKTFYMPRALSTECQILGGRFFNSSFQCQRMDPQHMGNKSIWTQPEIIFSLKYKLADYNIYCHINL